MHRGTIEIARICSVTNLRGKVHVLKGWVEKVHSVLRIAGKLPV